MGGTVDYFSAKEAVHRLEAAISKHVIVPPGDEAPRPAGEHVVDLSVKPSSERLADHIMLRRASLEKELEELRFLEDVAELVRKHPTQFTKGR